jgi:hypothetical protein
VRSGVKGDGCKAKPICFISRDGLKALISNQALPDHIKDINQEYLESLKNNTLRFLKSYLQKIKKDIILLKKLSLKKFGRFDYESWCFAGRLWSV